MGRRYKGAFRRFSQAASFRLVLHSGRAELAQISGTSSLSLAQSASSSSPANNSSPTLSMLYTCPPLEEQISDRRMRGLGKGFELLQRRQHFTSFPSIELWKSSLQVMETAPGPLSRPAQECWFHSDSVHSVVSRTSTFMERCLSAVLGTRAPSPLAPISDAV